MSKLFVIEGITCVPTEWTVEGDTYDQACQNILDGKGITHKFTFPEEYVDPFEFELIEEESDSSEEDTDG